MKLKSTLIICAFALISCNTNKSKEAHTTKTQISMEKTLTNKEKAVAVLESLETGDQTAIAYINPNKYIQHNLAVADGLAGFGEVLKHKPEGGFKAKVVRAFEDGNYVFTHTEYDFFGPKTGFDIFRFEDGLIVEHWDNLLEKTPVNPSGHTQTDGPTKSTDLDKTVENKAFIKKFIDAILINGQFHTLGNYFDGDTYIQHNPMIADGVSGLGAALEAMAKQGIAMVFTKNHIVLGEGNFVLAVSEGTFAGKPTSFYDLFRVENGKIAEHWDVMETILPEAERKNTNGKFGF
ncbi:MAG: nuclear transport factor 2 family protein [Bacteroidota bacterium]